MTRKRLDYRLTALTAGLALFAALGKANGSAALPDLTWLDWVSLEEGEIASRTSRDDDTIAVETAALIDARSEAIWEVITDCAAAPEYVPNVVACKHLERLDDGADVFTQTIRPPIFLIPRFEQVFRLEYTPYERIDMTWIRGGPVDRLQGAWWLLAHGDDEVLLVHNLEVEPAVPIPRFVLRATMRRELKKIMEAIKDRSEAIEADARQAESR